MDAKKVEELINKLTYTMQKKTYRIMELRLALNDMPKKFALPGTVSAVTGCYTAISYKTYANYALATFGTPNSILSNIKTMDLVVPLLLISGGITIYITGIKRSKVKNEYEGLRKDIMKLINNGFCNCGKSCSCKDDYIKAMEEIGINLVF